MCLFINLDSEMETCLKKDLRVSRVELRKSLNVFFFLLIGIFSQRFAMIRKKREQAHLESAIQRIVV
ncbi:hypothetical protein Ahy_A04g017156 isoform A [Arachis hypogaea]|uniref:Uncharacterized protein n=2 Tax=Arachis hypogaea TaxID=3818 RepID=A0A445DA76_ARAHY|nr:hypothetical protein Ahy_A04g017156 isoform A [Arachis hypogaea]